MLMKPVKSQGCFNMNRVLSGLEPERVFEIFEDICNIPHGSGDTKKISDYCVDFAKKRNLTVFQDELNNVIIKKSASVGYENCVAFVFSNDFHFFHSKFI